MSNLLNEYTDSSWDKAIRFGKAFRSNNIEDPQEYINMTVAIENIIDSFLYQIFGKDNKYINRAMDYIAEGIYGEGYNKQFGREVEKL